VALYLFGIYLEGAKSVATFFQELGQAIIIATAIVYLIERRVHGGMKAIVEDAAARMIQATAVNRGAKALDIEAILVRRGSFEERQDYLAAMRSALEQAIQNNSTLDLLCVAGPDFFRADGAHYRLLWEELLRPGNKACIRVLLLDPESQIARERANLEFGHGTIPDIGTAVETLSCLRKETGNRVEFKYHELPRSNFLVITEQTLFHEAYPTAPMRPPDGPIGGLVALLQYKKTSRAYRRWKEHFEYVWRLATPPAAQADEAKSGDGQQ
jgi:hypothetical protein